MKGTLIGRTAIITGGNQGLGFAIAKTFVKEGAHIYICARDTQKLAIATEELLTLRQSSEQRILSMPIDVSNPEDITSLAEQTIRTFGQIHILVSNAGIYGPMGPIETIDWNAWKQAIEINLYGPALLCRAFLPHFRQHHYGKIIQLSGGGATNPMPRFEAYAASKSAVVRLMESIAQDCQADHIDINCISPGLLDTRLLDEVLATSPDVVGKQYYQRMATAKENNQTVSLDMATALCVFLASSLSDGITGRLISALWDNYLDWPLHLQALQESDLYTLRRITGRERNVSWGDK